MAPALYTNIKKIRELKGLTREYMAEELNMSASGYGKIERGEVDLTLKKLSKISKILDVNIETIFSFNVNNFFK